MRAEQSRAEQSRAEQTGFPSIDKPWLKYYSEEAIQAELPECTVLQYIKNKNTNNLNGIALILSRLLPCILRKRFI